MNANGQYNSLHAALASSGSANARNMGEETPKAPNNGQQQLFQNSSIDSTSLLVKETAASKNKKIAVFDENGHRKPTLVDVKQFQSYEDTGRKHAGNVGFNDRVLGNQFVS